MSQQGRVAEPINDFSELQHAKYGPQFSSTFPNDPRKRGRHYLDSRGQPSIGHIGKSVAPTSEYQQQAARSVNSRSTFIGDEIDMGHETDFSVPKYGF